jgi:phosphatidylserine decarboxylase
MLFNPVLTLIIPIILFFGSLVILNIWPILFALIWLWTMIYLTRMGISVPISEQVLTSPAEGLIEEIKTTEGRVEVLITLNLFNIHSQHYPINGTVVSISHKPGVFDLIWGESKGPNNEKVITIVKNELWGDVHIHQVAGKMFRSISNVNTVHKKVTQGQLMGNIFLGSRVDIMYPKGKGELLVKEGQEIHIGDVIARLN